MITDISRLPEQIESEIYTHSGSILLNKIKWGYGMDR